MRIIYNTLKGKRYKKGTIKVKKYGKRISIFNRIECNGYWWHGELKKWILFEE